MAPTRTGSHRFTKGVVGLVAASVLVLGACSDDDSDGDGGDDTFENPTTEGADIRSTEAEADQPTEGADGSDAGNGGAVDVEEEEGDGVDGSSGAGGATETEGGSVGTTEG